MPTPSILNIEPASREVKYLKKNTSDKEKSPDIPAKRRRTVSEEGEISSESANSSSSSDDDSDLDGDGAESKRAANRRQRRENVKNNHYDMKRRMQEIYAQRFDVVCYLSTEQKVELLKSLRMVYDKQDDLMKSKIQVAHFLSYP